MKKWICEACDEPCYLSVPDKDADEQPDLPDFCPWDNSAVDWQPVDETTDHISGAGKKVEPWIELPRYVTDCEAIKHTKLVTAIEQIRQRIEQLEKGGE